MSMVYRVNAGAIPSGHWMQNPEVGGGRIIGEACHFVDYMTYLNGSLPVEVSAAVMDEPSHLEDTVTISLRFENGSIGTVHYFANGPKTLPKEQIEVFRSGAAGVLSDFKELRVYRGGKPSRTRLLGQSKGQSQMMARFLDAVRGGKQSPIPFDEIYAGMKATLLAVESARRREVLGL